MRLYFTTFDSHITLRGEKNHISATVFLTQPFDKMMTQFVHWPFEANLSYSSYDRIVSSNYKTKSNDHILFICKTPFAHDIINKNKLENTSSISLDVKKIDFPTRRKRDEFS